MRRFRAPGGRRRSTGRTSLGQTPRDRNAGGRTIETCEVRMVMAGQPLGEIALHVVEQPVAVDQTGAVDGISTHLSDAHALTGFDQARNVYGFEGFGQTVAVIDTGIAFDHEALGGGFGQDFRVVGGYDFAENDHNPYDDSYAGGHGTHVAGIVGSADDQHTGVAPGVDLVALRVFDDNGLGYFEWVEDALQWVHDNRFSYDNPITTVNLSLGAEWNSDSVPDWQILEDEFQQLEQDGIFISVSAGNSFTLYNTPGLGYPAASSYVVPVMSLDDNGALSYFSQRHQTAIAAPGRGIMSTVPDYLGDRDGLGDDFAKMSGTSMAAPYVAGASVLLREAYAFMGQSVDQDAIYQLMRDTAGSVYDPITGLSYLTLDLDAALDAVIPDDEYGNSAAAAHHLGGVGGNFALAGLIGTTDDADYFSFTAVNSGTLTLSLNSSGGDAPSWMLAGGGGTQSGNQLTFDIQAGQTYTFAVESSDSLAHYTVDGTLAAEGGAIDWTDLGAVESETLSDINLTAARSYQVTASRSGILTFEALFSHAAGNVDLEIYNQANQLVAASSTAADGERVDLVAQAGERFTLRVSGSNHDVDLRLTNLVSQFGDTVNITGTAGDDVFSFEAGANEVVTVNDVTYTFFGGSVNHFRFAGGGGYDRLTLTGTAANETATLDRHAVEFSGAGFNTSGTSVERVVVNGGGGADVALLRGTAGNETYIAATHVATLFGADYLNSVHDFRVITAQGGGGHDVARLVGSAGNDAFVVTPTSSYLAGGGVHLQADGFEEVRASGEGGYDVAIFHGGASRDEFYARPGYAQMEGGGLLNSAYGFAQVSAYATPQSDDVAWLVDSDGNDTFTGHHDFSSFTGSTFSHEVHNFGRVRAQATLGADAAYLYDSPSDDFFVTRDNNGQMAGNGFLNRVLNFDNIVGYADAGGYDQATLRGAASDAFRDVPGNATLNGNGYVSQAISFEYVMPGSATKSNVAPAAHALAANSYDALGVAGHSGGSDRQDSSHAVAVDHNTFLLAADSWAVAETGHQARLTDWNGSLREGGIEIVDELHVDTVYGEVDESLDATALDEGIYSEREAGSEESGRTREGFADLDTVTPRGLYDVRNTANVDQAVDDVFDDHQDWD